MACAVSVGDVLVALMADVRPSEAEKVCCPTKVLDALGPTEKSGESFALVMLPSAIFAVVTLESAILTAVTDESTSFAVETLESAILTVETLASASFTVDT